ncbi:MAG: hypothetical protein ACP5PA_07095 [Elusimicrobiales bacterium]
MGFFKRNNKIRVFPIQRRDNKTIQKILKTHTEAGSLYYTDDWHAYASLAVRSNHIVVSKEKRKI